MLACARLGAIHSVVFGGFAAHELATRIDDAQAEADRLGVLRHRGGPRDPLQAAAGRGDREGDATSRSAASSCCGRSARRSCCRAAISTGRTWCRARRRPTACRSRRPIRSTSSTPRAPRASPRAWCATMAAMPWRCAGRMPNIYDVAPGRGVLGGLGRRLGGRPQLHLLRAAAERQHHRALRGQAGRHARSGRVLAGDRAARRGRAVHRTDRVPRDQEGGSRTAPTCRATICRGSAPCSWPASAAIRTPCAGPRRSSRGR